LNFLSSLSWSRLPKRVIDLALDHCPSSGDELNIIAFILEQPVIEDMLTHLACRQGCHHARLRMGLCEPR
jgi:hypothetical protein